jgi:hypothetical protein
MGSSVDVVKSVAGLRPSFSAQVRWGEPGAPVDSLRCCYDTDRLPGLKLYRRPNRNTRPVLKPRFFTCAVLLKVVNQ